MQQSCISPGRCVRPRSIASTSSGMPRSTTFCAASRVLPEPSPTFCARMSRTSPDIPEIFPGGSKSVLCPWRCLAFSFSYAVIASASATRSELVGGFLWSFSSRSTFRASRSAGVKKPRRAGLGVAGVAGCRQTIAARLREPREENGGSVAAVSILYRAARVV